MGFSTETITGFGLGEWELKLRVTLGRVFTDGGSGKKEVTRVGRFRLSVDEGVLVKDEGVVTTMPRGKSLREGDSRRRF